ncbi:DUF4129 domain-containing protein [Pseudoxanthomonas kalamensis DSM 18571]|uniref:DUF4129 domain-containing protein n=1 Tax=Pseudoxanthomonas kalamensis TaxID=289483 RepID=UPI001391973F|nr:DUF4129 domain-containing protein [Pseudoxanthomonas kalamensis]KAF1712665.1 DUF4129 domain-containing protein [Pseudoxanthomonas kalamensis DSM 18571]
MRLDQLTVRLRARSPWEAVELGTALVRRHAGAVWKPWLWLTLPVFVLLNAAGWALDLLGLAGLLMWWLKPVFDRIPLYVISRATFGAVPSVRETLAAQRGWGWKRMLGFLTWRRLGPARSLYLPIDLLEGVDGARLRDRRRVLGGAVYGNAVLLTMICAAFEAMLVLGGVATIFMFVPVEYLPETVRAGWALINEQTPWWAKIGWNALCWLGMTLVEPYYVGAGFGLYLNRRTQIEAWDVEIAFRRLRQRLRTAAAPIVLLLSLAVGAGLAVPAAQAQERDTPPPAAQAAVEVVDADDGEDEDAPQAPILPEVFGEQRVDDTAFRKAVEQAYADPLLNGKRKLTRWERKPDGTEAEAPKQMPLPPWLEWMGKLFAFIGEWGLWILLAIAVVVLVVTARHWLPWMRGTFKRGKAVEAPATVETLPLPDALPENVAAAARRLWAEGKPRHALALLYRASVDAMVARAGVSLPPGATESECLRASRRMPDGEDRSLFARMVRVWQYAAYARRLPDEAEFEALLGQLQQRYGWAA